MTRPATAATAARARAIRPRRRRRRLPLLAAALLAAVMLVLVSPYGRRRHRFADKRIGGCLPSKPEREKGAGLYERKRENGLWKQTQAVLKRPSTWLALGALYLALRPIGEDYETVELPYSTFLQALDMGNRTHPAVDNVQVSPERYYFTLRGIPAETTPVDMPDELIKKFRDRNINFMAVETPVGGELLSTLMQIGMTGGLFLLEKGGFKGLTEGMNKVGERVDPRVLNRTRFADLKGMENSKREVSEIVDMLRNPAKYTKLGVRLPSGVLLVGPPGTGKTMLARAAAAEAGVPFFATSGADFVEVFAGRGAARVRQLFKQAEKHSPSVIFIDELDALGKTRSHIRLGGSDEAEQTLNMLLAAMDGLTTKSNGVIVLGATNRLDVLDPALIRPGRFDRIVKVERPTKDGREQILNHHASRLRVGADVDFGEIASETDGFAGADLELLVNEAAVRAVRRGSKFVEASDFQSSLTSYLQNRRRTTPGQDDYASPSLKGSNSYMNDVMRNIEQTAYQNGVQDVIDSIREEMAKNLKGTKGLSSLFGSGRGSSPGSQSQEQPQQQKKGMVASMIEQLFGSSSQPASQVPSPQNERDESYQGGDGDCNDDQAEDGEAGEAGGNEAPLYGEYSSQNSGGVASPQQDDDPRR